MLIDARLLPAELGTLETDICIVGAGPAGISIAREFAGQNLDVCLLESGASNFDPEVQALAAGSTYGDPIFEPINICRRQWGGNANVWLIKIGGGRYGVRYVPLDDVDFEERDWIPHSGWPFNKSHLIPFYERAQVVCQSGPFAYQPESWESEQAQRLSLDSDRVETVMFQFGPRDPFCEQYREELSKAENVKIYSNATVVEIEANEAGKSATRLRVARLGGKEFWISAKVFVLACGGFENARLLLMSNQQQTAGLGNQHDLVGRYYNDHPTLAGGFFTPTNPDLFNQTALYDLRQINGVSAMGHLKFTKQVLEQEQLLNMSALLFPRPSHRQFKGIDSFKYLAEAVLRYKEVPKNIPSHVLNAVMGLDYIAKASYLAVAKKQSLLNGFGRGGWSELPNNQNRFKMFEVIHQIEQAPDPSNRVTLGRDRDALGCPKLEVHWRWSQDDADRIARGQRLFAQELRRAGLGDYQIVQEDNLPKILRPSGTHHLMSTTRMHTDPKQGVVDANCRVHGLSNLYIAGSSVFPTGGYANPTLTIVALSLRLADQIKHELSVKQELGNVL